MGAVAYEDALQQVRMYSNAGADPVVTDSELQTILGRALVVDPAGVAPGGDGYVRTVSVEYAVSLVYELKATRATTMTGSVQSFTSEGTSVTRANGATATDFWALARLWAQRAAGGGGGGLSVIELDSSGSVPVARSDFYGVTSDEPAGGVWRGYVATRRD